MHVCTFFAPYCTHSRSQACVFTLLYLRENWGPEISSNSSQELWHTPCICTGSWHSGSDDMSGGCSATPESQRTIDRVGAEGSLGTGTTFPSAATCLPCHGGGMPTVWNHFSAETGKAGSLPLRSKRTWKRKRGEERKLSVDFVGGKKKGVSFPMNLLFEQLSYFC